MEASMSSVTKPQISTIDPVWEAVSAGARQVAQGEPVLSGLVYANVLNHDSFETALAHRLAERLDHPDVSADLIRQTFEDVLEASPEVGLAARADLVATLERDPACHKALDAFLYFKGFHAIQTHRFAHALWTSGRKDLALYLQSRSSAAFQVDINPAARIGRGIMLDHATGLVVGETATIGDDCSILQDVTLGGTGKAEEDRHPKVGNGVLIGAGAIILGNIAIGDGARIGAGSVVVKPVPPHVTVAGVPARVIGEAGCARPAAMMDQMLAVVDATG
jgi:serine O-acetyltransferase